MLREMEQWKNVQVQERELKGMNALRASAFIALELCDYRGYS